MRIGSLVKNNLYGSMGIIIDFDPDPDWAYVIWIKKPILEHLAYKQELEILCK